MRPPLLRTGQQASVVAPYTSVLRPQSAASWENPIGIATTFALTRVEPVITYSSLHHRTDDTTVATNGQAKPILTHPKPRKGRGKSEVCCVMILCQLRERGRRKDRLQRAASRGAAPRSEQCEHASKGEVLGKQSDQ